MNTMSVGDLSIRLGLYTGGMEQQASKAKDVLGGLDTAVAKLKKDLAFDNAISFPKLAVDQEIANLNKLAVAKNEVMAGGSGKGANYAMMAQQLGFGIQDFSSQVANSKNMVDGLGRGIMAVSNNVQMLGAAFGPTGLAVTAIGASVAGIVLPAVIKWLYNTDAIEKANEKLLKQYEEMEKRQEFISKAKAGDPNALIATEKQLKNEALIARNDAKAQDDEIAIMGRHREAIRQQAEEDIKEARRAAEATARAGGESDVAGDVAAIRAKADAEIAEINKQLEINRTNTDAKRKAAREADARRESLQPNIDVAKEIQQQQRIESINRELDSSKVISQRTQLMETQKTIDAEIKLFEQKRDKAKEADRAFLDNHISMLEEQKRQNEAVLNATGPHAAAAQQNEAFEVRQKQEEADQRERNKQFSDQEKRNQQALENNGSDRSRLLAKQKRERKEMFEATRQFGNSDEALAGLDRQHAVELQKQKISDQEKAIGMMGDANKGSAGVDLSSSEGIQAINRAISGGTEKSLAQQQLEVERNMLTQLEEIAKGGPAGQEFKDMLDQSKGEAVLGAPTEIFGDEKRIAPKVGLGEIGFNPEIQEVLNKKREREKAMSPVADVLAAKREREERESPGGKDGLKALHDIKRATEDAAKNKFKVVALGG